MTQRGRAGGETEQPEPAGAARDTGASWLPPGLTRGYPGIDARTRYVLLLGDPVEHSVSPQLHNAAFRQLDWNARYGAARVPAARLADAAAGLRGLALIGANVTVPHKKAIAAQLDGLDPLAARLGAVNTVAREADGVLRGYNTDAGGFLASVRQDGGFDPAGRHVTVLGAGGAARAVVLALVEAGAASITVVNRTPARGSALARQAAAWGGNVRSLALNDGDGLAAALAASALLVNATPVGMHPRAAQTPLGEMGALPAGALVMDLIFNPRQTRLLREAGERGLAVLDGLGMLVHQAALAWEHWFGRPGPAATMREAAARAVGRQGG